MFVSKTCWRHLEDMSWKRLEDILKTSWRHVFKTSWRRLEDQQMFAGRCESCSILRMSMLTIFNINDVNGVVLVSLLLTVNIFQTSSNYRLWTCKRFLGSNWKDKYFWRQDQVYHALCCSNLCGQNLLTNNIWSYTMTILRVNQWEILAKEFTLNIDSG